jgi:hypothetical protein
MLGCFLAAIAFHVLVALSVSAVSGRGAQQVYVLNGTINVHVVEAEADRKSANREMSNAAIAPAVQSDPRMKATSDEEVQHGPEVLPAARAGASHPLATPPESTGAFFDVPPVPEVGWVLPPHPPLPPDAELKALIEVSVSASGVILDWRVISASASLQEARVVLNGLENTRMFPAIKNGQAVQAVARYELAVRAMP